MATAEQPLAVRVTQTQTVSALLMVPDAPIAAFAFAHGAGAGMAHPFMASFAAGLAERGVATLRFQFPYMERDSRRPDPPQIAQSAVRAAVADTARQLAGLPLFAGGKSFGGRMTSQAQAAEPLPHVRGLVFVGFPLHPAGKPSRQRAEHLAAVSCPMLFLQGTRDALAELTLITQVTQELGDRATLKVFDDADHSFQVRTRSGSNNKAVRQAMLETTVEWMLGTIGKTQ